MLSYLWRAAIARASTGETMTARTHLTYIGHATVLIEMEGVRLLTDPLLRRRTVHLRRRGPALDPAWARAIDAVLLSHLHLDHYDLPSLRRLGRDTRLLVPRGAGPLLRRHGFRRIDELTAGDATSIGRLRVTATFAAHQGFRPPLGPTAEALGYLVDGQGWEGGAEGAGQRIYFAGDTDLFPAMADLGRRIDAALIPVWGWGTTLGTGHLTPERAAEALQLLRPRVAVPIHWGTLHPVGLGLGRPRFLTDPPHHFARHAARLAPDVRVEIVPPGASVNLDT